MEDSKQGNFMDSKTIIAIVLVGAVWIGWQNYLKDKYPDAYKKKQNVVNTEVSKNDKNIEANTLVTNTEKSITENIDKINDATIDSPEIVIEELTEYSDSFWKLVFSSKGMGLKLIELKKYTDRENKNINLSKNEFVKSLPFSTNLVGRNDSLNFKISKVSETEFIGKANLNGLNIKKYIKINSENYSLKVELFVTGINDQFSGITTHLNEKLIKNESSFFMPTLNNQELYVSHIQGSETDREYLNLETPYTGLFQTVDFYSLGSQYFATAIIDHSEILPELKVSVNTKTKNANATLTHSLLDKNNKLTVSFTGFAGPKDLKTLESVSAKLSNVIDYGWFSWLSIILFKIMAWFYGIFGNYGISIILLTILVRMIVLPFNLMSYKSMKKMQIIQPQIKELKEKYKDDQQVLNKEMMLLMKDNKANPIGGCLPMLFQFPIFIALYRVFGQSLDLYKAPFAFWITDLSLKDPFYILPVLMGVAFYFQTKLTPSTMDPTQQKVMMLMPVMFAFFMAGLPSALTLYMVISTLFGIGQQLFFMRDRSVTVSVSSVKA